MFGVVVVQVYTVVATHAILQDPLAENIDTGISINMLEIIYFIFNFIC